MSDNRESIILIGMPCSGKSTIGKLLAVSLNKPFIDTDVLIEQQQKKSLQHIVNEQGYLELRRIEANLLQALTENTHIIATGGSAVYSDAAMQHLKQLGIIIFLDVALTELQKRLNNFDTRGLARRQDQTFEDLFNERNPLYKAYADITINCTNKTETQIIQEIIFALSHK